MISIYIPSFCLNMLEVEQEVNLMMNNLCFLSIILTSQDGIRNIPTLELAHVG